MKKHYYLIGSLLGILCAFLLAYYLMGEHFILMLTKSSDSEKYYGLWGPLTGALTVLVCAVILDQKNIQKSYLISGLLLPVLIFTAGMVDGCLVNWAMNGNGLLDFKSWFVIPFFWLGAIGIPAAVIVGTLYYFVTRKINA